jgi:glycosyltransferase involved in cell wall biosynthesis
MFEIDNSYLQLFPKYYDKKEEINRVEKYYEICDKDLMFKKIREKKRTNPIISIIIPIYNGYNYIKRIMASIENQSFRDIDIIFVDDASTDKSVKLIRQYQHKDKRIQLVSHKENEGLLKTRNDGAIKARGEYLLFIDQNGILTEGALKNIYGNILMYNTDIIRFDTYNKYNNTFEKNDLNEFFKKEKVLYQPNILKQSFYQYKGELFQYELNLHGKVIRTKLYQEILNQFVKFYEKKSWNNFEDNAIDFLLLKNAKSYVFINEINYINNLDEYNNYSKDKNSYINDLFKLAKIIDNNTKNNVYEKLMVIYHIKRIINEFENDPKLVAPDPSLSDSLLRSLGSCQNILPQHKKYIEQLKQIIDKRK